MVYVIIDYFLHSAIDGVLNLRNSTVNIFLFSQQLIRNLRP